MFLGGRVLQICRPFSAGRKRQQAARTPNASRHAMFFDLFPGLENPRGLKQFRKILIDYKSALLRRAGVRGSTLDFGLWTLDSRSTLDLPKDASSSSQIFASLSRRHY